MSNGASDETIAAYAAQLLDLESDIEALQSDKKDVYANARETYGKRFADSLKLAIKRHRMDADKRDAADEIDAEAERMLAIISKPSAPRATRAREIIEEFDPETGEIKSPTTNGGDNETSAVPELVNPGRRQLPDHSAHSGANADEHQHPQPAATYIAPVESAADEISTPIPDNVAQIKKRWTFNDPAHRDCLDPTMCGGFSNLKLCQRCREASEGGQVA